MADENIEKPSFLASVVQEIVNSPLNLALVGLITFLVYKIIKSRSQTSEVAAPEPELPKIRRDFTVEELKQYDGNGEDGRVLVAVNGNVYDVTKGKRFYGPGMFDFLLFTIRPCHSESIFQFIFHASWHFRAFPPSFEWKRIHFFTATTQRT